MLAACAVAEAAIRFIDGYTLTSLRLTSVQAPLKRSDDSGKWLDPTQAIGYARTLSVANGIDPSWYELDPEEPPVEPVDSRLEGRYAMYRGHELPSIYEWNLRFIRAVLCEANDLAHPYLAQQLRRFNEIFVFEPSDSNPYPTYRFLRNAHYPSGLVTNSFGWRGPEVALNKPAGRVRLAFVGASTTADAHADRFSYPEYIARWLTRWADAHHPSISFDVINAGREGILSNSIAAIVNQELVPMRPDVTVYYEGANQFWPNSFSPRPVIRMFRVAYPGLTIDQYTALGARLRNALVRGQGGAEPYKLPVSVAWPPDLDEHDPSLDDPRLPVQLPTILQDLDRIRHATAEIPGTLMLSSFMWLVYPGMVLDRQRDALVYRELNEQYWPFSYAHMRRFIDFENRVFRKYAQMHDLPFNDLAATYPRDPRLFVDSIHMTPAGVKLKAWIVFQHLVPVLERRLQEGTLPVSDPNRRSRHPAFLDNPRRVVRLEEIRRSCRE